jgi:hypothetical protein
VLAVHRAFGFAPHIGQRTDNICFNVTFPGFSIMEFTVHHGRPIWWVPTRARATKQRAD